MFYLLVIMFVSSTSPSFVQRFGDLEACNSAKLELKLEWANDVKAACLKVVPPKAGGHKH